MRKIAFLEYAFLFDSDTFDNLYDFEKLLSQVLRAKGYEAHIIDALRGSQGRRVVLVKRIVDPLNKPIAPVKDLKNQKKVDL